MVPLERLFVIRSNIKQFINKWGVKKENLENNPNLEQKNKLSKIVDSMKQLEDKVITYRQGSELATTQPASNNQSTNQLQNQNTNTHQHNK